MVQQYVDLVIFSLPSHMGMETAAETDTDMNMDTDRGEIGDVLRNIFSGRPNVSHDTTII